MDQIVAEYISLSKNSGKGGHFARMKRSSIQAAPPLPVTKAAPADEPSKLVSKYCHLITTLIAL